MIKYLIEALQKYPDIAKKLQQTIVKTNLNYDGLVLFLLDVFTIERYYREQVNTLTSKIKWKIQPNKGCWNYKIYLLIYRNYTDGDLLMKTKYSFCLSNKIISTSKTKCNIYCYTKFKTKDRN